MLQIHFYLGRTEVKVECGGIFHGAIFTPTLKGITGVTQKNELLCNICMFALGRFCNLIRCYQGLLERKLDLTLSLFYVFYKHKQPSPGGLFIRGIISKLRITGEKRSQSLDKRKGTVTSEEWEHL